MQLIQTIGRTVGLKQHAKMRKIIIFGIVFLISILIVNAYEYNYTMGFGENLTEVTSEVYNFSI